MSRRLLIWIDWSLLCWVNWSLKYRSDQSGPGLTLLSLHSAYRATDWTSKATCLVLDRCMLQKVFRQDVRAVERVLFSVRERVCFRQWEVGWGCRHLAQLVTVYHVLCLGHHVVLAWLQHRALHSHDRFSACLHFRADEAGDVRVWTGLSAAVVQLTQTCDLRFLRSWLVWC